MSETTGPREHLLPGDTGGWTAEPLPACGTPVSNRPLSNPPDHGVMNPAARHS